MSPTLRCRELPETRQPGLCPHLCPILPSRVCPRGGATPEPGGPCCTATCIFPGRGRSAGAGSDAGSVSTGFSCPAEGACTPVPSGSWRSARRGAAGGRRPGRVCACALAGRPSCARSCRAGDQRASCPGHAAGAAKSSSPFSPGEGPGSPAGCGHLRPGPSSKLARVPGPQCSRQWQPSAQVAATPGPAHRSTGRASSCVLSVPGPGVGGTWAEHGHGVRCPRVCAPAPRGVGWEEARVGCWRGPALGIVTSWCKTSRRPRIPNSKPAFPVVKPLEVSRWGTRSFYPALRGLGSACRALSVGSESCRLCWRPRPSTSGEGLGGPHTTRRVGRSFPPGWTWDPADLCMWASESPNAEGTLEPRHLWEVPWGRRAGEPWREEG